ncbi:MAG: hypothetical protein JXA52_09350 [Planctomycetes bacterium]|nr:hypothetical protein [Planctomycetota bacterium]
MSIDFSQQRWEQLKEDYKLWWAGELKRPLIHVSNKDRDPGRPEPEIPSHWSQSFYDLSVTSEEIVDRWDYDLSCRHYLGDSYPFVLPNFGPGVIAAFLGADLENGERTVWFHPKEEKEAKDLSLLGYDPDNLWLNRVKDVSKAAIERWEGLVQVSYTDLGGNLDILSTFRPAEKMLLDLYDCPEEIKRMNWEAHEMWWKYYNEFTDILHPLNPGYTTWTRLFSEEPFYILQCDFCYMISPEMFEEFVKPELVASCQKLTNSFYHLDGPGALRHLDSLLEIEELGGIQWIPGAGAKPQKEWPEVYKKVRDAGKLIQLQGDLDTLDTVATAVGSAEGMLLCGNEISAEDLAECKLKWG